MFYLWVMWQIGTQSYWEQSLNENTLIPMLMFLEKEYRIGVKW